MQGRTISRAAIALAVVLVCTAAILFAGAQARQQPPPPVPSPAVPSPAVPSPVVEESSERAATIAGPTIAIETDKGVIEFETYPDDAPKSVAHVVALVEQGFYDGQRIQRAEPGFVVQFGDPQSRDLDKRARWGRGPGDGSGTPIGVAEFSMRRQHVRGAVGMAHAGDPMQADSQIYITLAPHPQLDGLFVVVGQVVRGDDVLERLERGEVIRRVTVSATGAGR